MPGAASQVRERAGGEGGREARARQGYPGRLLAELKTVDAPDNKFLYYRQLRESTLEFPDGVHFNLDGEPTHETRITFSVLPKRLKVAF